MILTDTSVVIDLVRSADRKLQQLIVTHSATICGVTRAEVLVGARDAAHRVRMLAALQLFQRPRFPMHYGATSATIWPLFVGSGSQYRSMTWSLPRWRLPTASNSGLAISSS